MEPSTNNKASNRCPEPEQVGKDGEEGKEAFPRKYTEFSWKTITPGDLVDAVLPVNTFEGKTVEVTKTKDRRRITAHWKAAFKKSAMDAEDQLEDRLSCFGVELATIPHKAEEYLADIRRRNPTLATQFPPIKGHRWAVEMKEPRTRSVYYYCRRCLQLKGYETEDPSRVKFAVVAAGRLSRIDTGKRGEAKALLTVNKLFPHDWACSLPCDDMRATRFLDKNRFGSGAVMVDFPYDCINRNTFTRLVQHVSAHHPQDGNLPIGDQIFPDPTAGSQLSKTLTYPFDRRFYEYLPTLNSFFGDVISTEDYREFMLRFWYWFAGKFSISSQMHNVQFSPITTRVGSTVFPTWPLASSDVKQPHLQLNGVAAIWGGHQTATSKEAVDQLLHCDIPYKPVRTVIDGRDCIQDVVVSNNPALLGLFRPGSILLPLQDYRTLVTVTDCTKEEDDVTKGEMAFFCGDFTHAGKTYATTDPSWHLSLHIYVDSDHHKRAPADQVEMSHICNALLSPEHAVYLDKETVEEMEAICEEPIVKLSEVVEGKTMVMRSSSD